MSQRDAPLSATSGPDYGTPILSPLCTHPSQSDLLPEGMGHDVGGLKRPFIFQGKLIFFPSALFSDYSQVLSLYFRIQVLIVFFWMDFTLMRPCLTPAVTLMGRAALSSFGCEFLLPLLKKLGIFISQAQELMVPFGPRLCDKLELGFQGRKGPINFRFNLGHPYAIFCVNLPAVYHITLNILSSLG